jgi:UDP-arabinose 4-epimerase
VPSAIDRHAVLVTGGAGYVGSHTCKALDAAGYLPVTLDDLSRGSERAVRWGPLEVVVLGDDAGIATVLDTYRPVGVIHFAALAYVGESVEDPERYYRNNVAGTLSLLHAMRTEGVDRLIFSSTCATYGTPRSLPIGEDEPQEPVNPYGRSKLMVERVLGDYDAAYGLRHVALRYFNAAGADPDGDIGEVHDPETHLVPLVIQAALGQRDQVAVYGTDYPTPDGTAVRDYVHVTDLAAAHVQALAYLMEGGASTRLNLGTGRGHSVREVIRTVERVTGNGVVAHAAPRRPGDPPVLVADARRAGDVLGWHATMSDLDTIVGTAAAWHARAGPSGWPVAQDGRAGGHPDAHSGHRSIDANDEGG